MTSRKLRRSLGTGLVVVCIGIIGCGDSSSETGNAGIPGHRGPATASKKKLTPIRPSSRARGGVR